MKRKITKLDVEKRQEEERNDSGWKFERIEVEAESGVACWNRGELAVSGPSGRDPGARRPRSALLGEGFPHIRWP